MLYYVERGSKYILVGTIEECTKNGLTIDKIRSVVRAIEIGGFTISMQMLNAEIEKLRYKTILIFGVFKLNHIRGVIIKLVLRSPKNAYMISLHGHKEAN